MDETLELIVDHDPDGGENIKPNNVMEMTQMSILNINSDRVCQLILKNQYGGTCQLQHNHTLHRFKLVLIDKHKQIPALKDKWTM